MAAPIVRIEAGDMLDVLPRLIAEGVRVHAIVTDPPYGLAFMGRRWDDNVAFQPETWRLCYDLLPPGGHLLAFGGTRTYHRIACAIEDAGFEIRDMLAWLYGSGFPKSHNVSKAIDRAAGASGTFGDYKSARHADPRHYPDGMERPHHSDDAATDRNGRQYQPGTDDARAWDGWGTALKPALEPLCIARKPVQGTVASNVQAHGTGAFNIDACRIDASARRNIVKNIGKPDTDGHSIYGNGLSPCSHEGGSTDQGRWPANICHDGSEEVLAAFPDANHKTGGPSSRSIGGNGIYGGGAPVVPVGFGDNGSAARFFYSAKADAGDRLQSKHPTIKPVDLMRWLVRLVTPPGGTVLDPFAGSGTTAMACMAEGFDCIAVEREAEYVADIRRRVAHVHGTDTPLFGG